MVELIQRVDLITKHMFREEAQAGRPAFQQVASSHWHERRTTKGGPYHTIVYFEPKPLYSHFETLEDNIFSGPPFPADGFMHTPCVTGVHTKRCASPL